MQSGLDLTTCNQEEFDSGLVVMEALLQEGIASGEFRDITPYTAEIMAASLTGLIFQLINNNVTDKDCIKKMAAECADILMNGFRK
jgi:hypothetical protein